MKGTVEVVISCISIVLAGCGRAASPCGPGTQEVNGQCVAVPAAPAPPPPLAAAPPAGPPRDVTREVVFDVTASTYKGPVRRYAPEKAFDSNPSTAWNENSEGPGVGDWIEARLWRPTRITHLTVTPGWDGHTKQGMDLFTINRYMTRFDLEYDGGQRTFEVPEGTREFRADLGGVTASRFRITARAVQAVAPRWDDLAISEIHVFEATDPGANPSAPVTRTLDVLRPLQVVRPSGNGVGQAVEWSTSDSAASGLPTCGGPAPCLVGGAVVRFRPGAACRGRGSNGIWVRDPETQEAVCVPTSVLCGRTGITEDPQGEVDEVQVREGACGSCPAPTRHLQRIGSACRGHGRGWTWQCGGEPSWLVCSPPAPGSSFATHANAEPPSPARPIAVLAGSFPESQPGSRGPAEALVQQLAAAGFPEARLADSREYPNGMRCCFWVVMVGSCATRQEATVGVAELQAAGFNACTKRPLGTKTHPPGVDQDCDGVDGVDGDGDAHASWETGGDDCDDTDGGTWQVC